MKAFKVIIIGISPILLILISGHLYLLYKNNLDTSYPDKQEIKQALDKSINWVFENQDTLIKENNPALWWFLDESATLTDNENLAALVDRYRYTVLNRNSVWSGYWVKTPNFTYITGSLDYMEKYQKFFAYGLTCDRDLGEEKGIKDQFDINFCDWRPFYSSCITHQMMVIRLLQIKQCGDQELNEKLSNKLADLIESQLIWDPRVGDVYIQRVLMLVESGNADKVKPVWFQRILNEQRSSGAWVNFYRLFNITETTEFGFGYKVPEIRASATDNLHTTAQAIYLLSLIHAGLK